ncbi:HAMP domain-containing protein [Streptomyces sp. NBC_01352]|uniref:ATP-binding protein n=1 Tax=unclassified Streptomyces TaxID=2593676 RepID=UPI00224FC738|nr:MULTISPECIES: ATP-binding protein [unclassified Streptomyces]MCX4697152.1 HAMP domain-containing protein [Streptomyces sp. NBC_01373]
MSTNEPRGGVRGFADRWPFRRKLNVLVGVPLAVLAALLAYLIADQVDQARTANAAAQLVRDSAQVAELVDRVETEHQQAILLSVRHEAAPTGARPSTADYRKAQAAVDSQVEKVRDTFDDRLPDTEAQSLREINGLTSLRDTVEQGYLPADNIDPAYTNASKGLIDGLGLDHNADLAGTFTGNLLDSLLRADAAHSAFETAVFSARTGDSNAQIEFIGAVGFENEYTHQADRFARFATEAQADELGGIEHNSAQATIGRHYAELQIDPGNLQAGTPTQIREAFTEALGSYRDYRMQSETRLKITSSLIGQIADRADSASSEAAWRAVLLLGLALFLFAVWIAFAVLVRRSVVRPVQALTGAAREVADVAGRELARVADEDTEDDGPVRLREIPVTAKDEIGDLADAFNHVQTTASALLERQVLSRRNVAEMFGNVGRRVSNLTARQLALIDAVERGETDPALLERLYSIDHIAVRLRRNADSLMLLAGIRETVLDSGPLALTNVVRAALGQIEGFQRVHLHAGTEAMVEPDIIGDLTLMVAELVENAVSFSPAGSPVEVTVRDGAEGALVIVADHGLGMSTERLEEENARLIRRERLDLVPTKVLGLFVVGTLARRWEVSVTLSRTPGGGVTAEVAIPSSLLLTMSPVAVASGGSAGGGTGASGGSAGGGTGRALASGSASVLEAGAVSGSGSEAGSASGPRAASGSEAGSASGPETGARSGSASGAAAGSGSGSAASQAAATTAGSGSSSGTGAGAAAGSGSASDSRSEASSGSVSGAGRIPAAAAASAAEAGRAGSADAGPGVGSTADEPVRTARTASPNGSAPGDDEPAPLPRRVPRRDTAPTDTPATSDPNGTSTAAGPNGTSTAPGLDATPTIPNPDREPATLGTDTSATSDPNGTSTAAGPNGTSTAPARDATPTIPDRESATLGGESTVPGPKGKAPDGSQPADAPFIPRARAGEAATAGTPTPASDDAPGARPLRRRVRGATLRTTFGTDPDQQAARQAAPRATDADAVRDALDEFEAAVERAHRDSGNDTATTPYPVHRDSATAPNPPHHQNHSPEGAEQ